MDQDQEEQEKTLITHESIPDDKPWGFTSCCYNVDSRMFNFTVCTVVSLSVLFAGIHAIAHEPSCDTYGFWGPFISLIVGIWTPTPKKSKTSRK